MEKKKKKIWPILLLVLLLAGVVVYGYTQHWNKPEQETADHNLYTVGRGDLTLTVSGSGSLQSEDSLTLYGPGGVKVEEIAVKPGDKVQKGDKLLKLDVVSLEKRSQLLQQELSALDGEMLRLPKLSDSILSPQIGRVKTIYAAEGDDIAALMESKGALALLSLNGRMKLFFVSHKELKLEDSLTVKWDTGSVKGKVEAVSAEGVLVSFPDDKAPYGIMGQVYDGDELLGEGVMDIAVPYYVYGSKGIIATVHIKENATVMPNTKLFTLSDAPYSPAYSSKLSQRTEKAEELSRIEALIKAPYLTACEDGIIAQILVQENSEIGSMAATGDVACFLLHTGGATKLVVSIDELDIPKLAIGQQAEVNIDALPNNLFSATVSRISYLGSLIGSTTGYTVELSLQSDNSLLEGMNGSATILSQQVENTLLIPIGAIMEDGTGSYVLMGENKVYIETGLSDGVNAQILSGLREGDVIFYDQSITDPFEKLRSMGFMTPGGGH